MRYIILKKKLRPYIIYLLIALGLYTIIGGLLKMLYGIPTEEAMRDWSHWSRGLGWLNYLRYLIDP